MESPTKSNTIKKFLNANYKILASYGHVRDLPKSELGVDIEKNFQPHYLIPQKARKNVHLLKKEAEKADLLFLACDPDREGEAIAWHLVNVLNLNVGKDGKKKKYKRIVFHEITKEAVEHALSHPRDIDMHLVNAQQARRILDRLVGYKLSPFLWKKVKRGLSAGRVQSVAVKLIAEREKEIENFTAQEYWSIEVLLKKEKAETEPTEFSALLIQKSEKKLNKLDIKNEQQAQQIVQDLQNSAYQIISVESKQVKSNPPAPFTTSTLQQEAWKKFHWPAKTTMNIAQQLYEKGYCTYHRTDSLNLSSFALNEAKNFIVQNYGAPYYQLRKYKTRSQTAQEAHEAIRPTQVHNTPQRLTPQLEKNLLKLYTLIWQRFVACQMSSAIFDALTVRIQATPLPSAQNKDKSSTRYVLAATGQTLKFPGFLKVYPQNYKESLLPSLSPNEQLALKKVMPQQHFTQPPSRYNEATLIKELEKNGIGRPSTYAIIISTIQERNYVQKDEKKFFHPTSVGLVVNEMLSLHFPQIVDINFTAKMEQQLDDIAQGKENWVEVLKKFYYPFEKNLQQKEKEVAKKELAEKTNELCPLCHSPLVIRWGKFGRFYACQSFPKCNYTASLPKPSLGIPCPKCAQGEIVEKTTKNKKVFWGCSLWPQCDFALWDKPLNEKCPTCGSLMVQNKRKKIVCSNKNCPSNLHAKYSQKIKKKN